jgi:hypothetical protein
MSASTEPTNTEPLFEENDDPDIVILSPETTIRKVK